MKFKLNQTLPPVYYLKCLCSRSGVFEPDYPTLLIFHDDRVYLEPASSDHPANLNLQFLPIVFEVSYYIVVSQIGYRNKIEPSYTQAYTHEFKTHGQVKDSGCSYEQYHMELDSGKVAISRIYSKLDGMPRSDYGYRQFIN